MLVAIVALATNARAADVVEWQIDDPTLTAQTTSLLIRYFTVIRADSTMVRYLRARGDEHRYTIRARYTDTRDAGEIILITSGQLQLYSPENVRIALGEELYATLLGTRRLATTTTTSIDLGDSFGHTDWIGDHRVVVSLLERIDLRADRDLNLYVAIGAPESNQSFWSDGSLRIGAATPTLECDLILPFSSGSIGSGPITSRRVAPGIGGSAKLSIGSVHARLRFTEPVDATLTSTRSIPRAFIHSLSSELSWTEEILLDAGSVAVTGGFCAEEYSEVKRVDGGIITDGAIRRLSPVASVRYTGVDEVLRLELGTYDQALRGIATVRLSKSLWFEVRAVATGLFRQTSPFEHPFSLFLTPRFKL